MVLAFVTYIFINGLLHQVGELDLSKGPVKQCMSLSLPLQALFCFAYCVLSNLIQKLVHPTVFNIEIIL